MRRCERSLAVEEALQSATEWSIMHVRPARRTGRRRKAMNAPKSFESFAKRVERSI